MRSNKLLPLLSYLGIAVLAFGFLYNFIYALAADIDPVIPAEAMIFALPMAVGLFLVPYGLKGENRLLIYVGNVISVVSAMLLVFQTGRLCFDGVSGIPNVAFLLTMVWPLLMLLASLTMMAFYKKVDFRPIHNIVTLVGLGGVALSALVTLLIMIIWSVQFSSFLVFLSLFPTLLNFVAIAPVVLLAFLLKNEARLVKLEVPEWVKPVKPAPAPKVEPALEPKVEAPEEKPAVEEPAENKEEAPKA